MHSMPLKNAGHTVSDANNVAHTVNDAKNVGHAANDAENVGHAVISVISWDRILLRDDSYFPV